MQFRQLRRDGSVVVRVLQKALVRPLDWRALTARTGPDTANLVIDLEEVEFISSIFLQSCVEQSRKLAERDGRIVLLHLNGHQKYLLELIEGSNRLSVLDSTEELSEHLENSVSSPASEAGVTPAEKRFLWR